MRFANFPFAPARSPFFYGWVIVAASTLGTILSIPGQTMGVGAFTDSLIADLRISREDLSSAYMYGTVTSACVLPLAGRAFDVLGARILVVSSSLSLAATLVFLSVNETVTTWVAKHALPEQDRSTLSFGVLCCGFFFVRFWGQGVLTMSSRAMLGKWFDRRRGFASGLSGIFVSASFASAPVLLIWRIDSLGWRGAWVELAGICTVWAVIAWILCRDNPEECGLLMDGEEPTNRDDTDGPPEISRDFTLVDALRTPAFWIPA
ncbi:MAG: MFS transporter, partial [Planctomycetota bacterium]